MDSVKHNQMKVLIRDWAQRNWLDRIPHLYINFASLQLHDPLDHTLYDRHIEPWFLFWLYAQLTLWGRLIVNELLEMCIKESFRCTDSFFSTPNLCMQLLQWRQRPVGVQAGKLLIHSTGHYLRSTPNVLNTTEGSPMPIVAISSIP